jgi:hypothetical protein
MRPARTNLRSALDRLMVTAIAAPLVAIAMVAPRDAALAQSHIATLLDVKPALAKSERETKSLHKRERCDEHGGCSGLIVSAGAPKPLPVRVPIGAKPMAGTGGTWIEASGGYPIGSGPAGAGTGTVGASAGGSTPVNTPPAKPPAPVNPGRGAASKGSSGPAVGGALPTDNGGAINE